MRHFLHRPTAISRLPRGMSAPSPRRLLIFRAGPPLRFLSCPLSTVPRAVHLPAIAATANQAQPTAASTAIAPQRRQLRAPPTAGRACLRAMTMTACRVDGLGWCQGGSMRRGSSCPRSASRLLPPPPLPRRRGGSPSPSSLTLPRPRFTPTPTTQMTRAFRHYAAGLGRRLQQPMPRPPGLR